MRPLRIAGRGKMVFFVFALSPVLSIAGLPPGASLQINSLQEHGELGSDSIESKQSRISEVSERLTLQLPEYKRIQIQAQLVSSRPDYSQYIIRDRRGNERKLSDDFSGRTYQGGTSVVLSWDKWQFITSIDLPLASAPVKQKTYQIGSIYSLPEYASGLGLSLQRVDHFRPISYIYSNEQLLNIEQPSQTRSDNLLLFFEQGISERMKMRLSTEYRKKSIESPDVYGGKLDLSYALWEETVLYSGGSFLKERSHRNAQNLVGKQSLSSWELGAGTEITSRWHAYITGGTSYEKIEASELSAQRFVAFDTYSASTDFRWQQLTLRGSLKYLDSRGSFSRINLSSELVWEYL